MYNVNHFNCGPIIREIVSRYCVIEKFSAAEFFSTVKWLSYQCHTDSVYTAAVMMLYDSTQVFS